MLIYIHGFNSSPASYKAKLLADHMHGLGRGNECLAPELPHRPALAMRRLEALIEQHPNAALIGSSLGGYYATWLAEKYGARAALLNPAVRPHDLLAPRLGAQKNLYTGEVYELTAAHIDELRELEVARITPARYFLLTCTGDETLNYRDGVARYAGAKQHIIQGGDHGLSSFAEYLGEVLNFCGVNGVA